MVNKNLLFGVSRWKHTHTRKRTEHNKNWKCKYYAKNVKILSKSGDLLAKRFVFKYFTANSNSRGKSVSVNRSMFFRVPQVHTQDYLQHFIFVHFSRYKHNANRRTFETCLLHFVNRIFFVISFAQYVLMNVFKYHM